MSDKRHQLPIGAILRIFWRYLDIAVLAGGQTKVYLIHIKATAVPPDVFD